MGRVRRPDARIQTREAGGRTQEARNKKILLVCMVLALRSPPPGFHLFSGFRRPASDFVIQTGLSSTESKLRKGSRMKRGVDYIGVGVGAILVDGDGRLFLARRGPRAKNERGLWEFPGGSVEFGEQLAAALQREMREEYGIEISVGDLLDVVDHILPEEGQHWVSPTYICRITSGTPEILEPDKCAEIGWFHLHEIPAQLTQVTRINFEHYRQRLDSASLSRTADHDRSHPTVRS